MSQSASGTEAVAAADHEFASSVATAAGERLLDLRESGLVGEELKELGDQQSHVLLVAALADRYPDDGVLSEEGDHDTDRIHRRRAWIIDPLDGTREFSEPPRTDWAVHVALAVDGIAVAGAVALPARGLTLGT